VWRNAEANRLHADLAILCPGYGRVCRRLTAERSLARAQIARCRISRLRELDTEIRDLASQLTRLVAASRTRLTDIVGIGPILAARILGEVGEISCFPDADHFAAANGPAPIPVASGRTDRHRLNRGGNRPTQPRGPPFGPHPGHLGTSRGRLPGPQQAEGKTRREALRCLKRRLSTIIFNTLVAGPKPPPAPHPAADRGVRAAVKGQAVQ
jgi:hypothetical protein